MIRRCRGGFQTRPYEENARRPPTRRATSGDAAIVACGEAVLFDIRDNDIVDVSFEDTH